MTDPLGVTPSELRATSKHLKDVSTRMKAVQSSLRGKLRGEGAPWEGGKLGDEFSKGEKGFVAQLDGVDESVDAKTLLLDHYSSGLKRAADSFEQQDEG
jgi:uncharacterized protein YukE